MEQFILALICRIPLGSICRMEQNKSEAISNGQQARSGNFYSIAVYSSRSIAECASILASHNWIRSCSEAPEFLKGTRFFIEARETEVASWIAQLFAAFECYRCRPVVRHSSQRLTCLLLLPPGTNSHEGAAKKKWNQSIQRVSSEYAPTASGWCFALPEKTG
jgi:hypothetical protein